MKTLGFSPFELLFARSVKGLLAVMKQAWLSDDELSAGKPNVVEFVLETRDHLRNAPSTFSRLVAKLLLGCDKFCDAYLNDLLIFSETWEEHVKHLRDVFEKIREASSSLTANPCKYIYC